MCKAVEDFAKENKIIGMIEFLKRTGHAEEEILQIIVENTDASKEYVENLMNQVTA